MLRHESSYEGRTIGYIHVHLYLHANSLTNNSFQVMGYERAMYFKKDRYLQTDLITSIQEEKCKN